MREHIRLFGFLVASVSLLAFCVPAEAQRDERRNPREAREQYEETAEPASGSDVGKVLPLFSGKDLVTGEPFSLEDLRGRIVLVDFWATWCRPCIAELPNVKKTYKEYHDKGFEIVSISLDTDVKKCRGFVDRKNMDWHQIAEGGGWDTRLAKKYGIRSIPAMFILDANGVVVSDRARGENLAKAIEAAMKKTPPQPAGNTQLQRAEELLAAGNYVAAMEAFEAIATKHTGTETAIAAQKHIDGMNADPEIARAIEQVRAEKERAAMERKTGNWLRAARALARSGKHDAARKNYRRVIDNYPKSEAAGTARREMATLP